jgi:hypothetical protein
MNRQDHAAAFHEAGHAFAAWKFQFRVKRMSIVPKGDCAGYVVSKSGLHLRSLEFTNPSGARIGRLHERIVSLLAGRAAQRRYCARSVRSHHAQSDLDNVYMLLSRLHTADEIPHVFRYLEAKAKNLVEPPLHWFVIEHLASQLLKHRTMTGPEVEAAIRGGYDRELAGKIGSKLRGQLKRQ